jgi:hypothetical protein
MEVAMKVSAFVYEAAIQAYHKWGKRPSPNAACEGPSHFDTFVAGYKTRSAVITVEVMKMKKSEGADYFVKIDCDGRSVTPHVFSERWKAEYEVHHYKWVFGLSDTQPEFSDYNETTHPNT